jgi:hypothetical protein
MGLKKIAELRKELSEQAAALSAFTKAAGEFVATYAKIAAAYAQVEELRENKKMAVHELKTLGIKEFEDYKKGLIGVFEKWGNRPLPLKPLEDLVARKKKEVDDAVQARVAKMAASFPAEVKPGMLFRFEPTKVLWEIKSGPLQAKNENLKGKIDAVTYFKYQPEGGSENNVTLETLKKSCKYIKVS